MRRKSATPAHKLSAPATRRRIPPSAFGRLTDELITRIFKAVEALDHPDSDDRDPWAELLYGPRLYKTRRSPLTRINRRWYKVCTPILWKSIILKPNNSDPKWVAGVLDKFKPKIKDFLILVENPSEQDVDWICDVFSETQKMPMRSLCFDISVEEWQSGYFERAADLVRFAADEVEALSFDLSYDDSDTAEGYPVISDMLDTTPRLKHLTVTVDYTVGRGVEPLSEEYHGWHRELLVEKAKKKRPKLKTIEIDGLEPWMEGGGSEYYDPMGNWC